MNKFKDLIKLYAKERIENPKQFPKISRATTGSTKLMILFLI